ncbi:MAG: metallophosphoesterase [Clostridia bacterium]|nr:metallophosphoesterase [Clostridia bacterium]
MIYFIADTHFGHENIIKSCGRPFTCANEMNEALISNWNERVKLTDSVYVIGDMFFRCREPESILKRLRGKKHLIVGNHDADWMKKVDMNKYFRSVNPMIEMSDGAHAITLCHYPLLSWNHEKRSFMIHGHIHNTTDLDFWPLLVSRENVLNAGVDINGFRPVTFNELMANNVEFKLKNNSSDHATENSLKPEE